MGITIAANLILVSAMDSLLSLDRHRHSPGIRPCRPILMSGISGTILSRGAATGGGCSPGRGPADIGTPSELPTGGAPGICPAVSERPVLTRPGGLRRVGRTRPLAPDWVARDRREKSGRAGQGYPAAWCDERRPASLVTRRGGVPGVWRRVGVRGRSRATNGATTRSVRPTPGQHPCLATIGVVLPGRVLSCARSRGPAAG